MSLFPVDEDMRQEFAILRRYRGESWSIRQQELLSGAKILALRDRLSHVTRTLRRWYTGEKPIPAYASFDLAGATGDWRYLQSYAVEYGKTFASTHAHASTTEDLEIQLMHLSHAYSKLIELALRLKSKTSKNVDADKKLLRAMANELHAGIESLVTSVEKEDKQ